MTDPLSVSAGVIAVVALAYNSSKALYEFVKDIHGAPKTLKDLKVDLEALQQVLNSLRAKLDGVPNANLSDSLKWLLDDINPPLEGCAEACEEFHTRLMKITPNSNESHTSFRNKVKLQFQDKDIVAFRYRLGSYKATLNVALSFASLCVVPNNIHDVRTD